MLRVKHRRKIKGMKKKELIVIPIAPQTEEEGGGLGIMVFEIIKEGDLTIK